MILLVVWDGLRPDMIAAGRTPFLYRMARQGALCQHSHAVYPTATRINSASLSTGCSPGRHGIVDNELYVPAIDPQRPISCADWRALQHMADLEGERLVSVPTLGESLRAAGLRMASAGSGSPGTTYLTNPTVTGPVVNWALAWPEETAQEVTGRYGAFLGPESSAAERTAFVLRVALEHLIPEHRPDVLTLWLTEPDHAQHRHGLAAPQTLATLAELDGQFQAFWEGLARATGGDGHTCFLLSDHGFSTISNHVDLDEALIDAGLKAGPDSADMVRTGSSVYLNGEARDRLPEVVRLLAGLPQVGALLVRDDLLPACPEAMPQSAALGGHRRSAELMYAYQWSAAQNAYGVAGSVCGRAGKGATHGSASPFDINNCLVAWGEGIAPATTSTVPCGIVDLAPTVLHLLGVALPPQMEGRVLHELLDGGRAPEGDALSYEAAEVTYRTANGPRRQVAWYSRVGQHRYLDRIEMERDV